MDRQQAPKMCGVTGFRQAGAVTMFSAILILILLTEMVIYAVQTGVFEQRKSSNEMRQKAAFHQADSAIQQAKHFFLANSVLVSSDQADLLPNGTDGWLAAGAEQRWQPCSTVAGTSGTHPCFAEGNPTFRAGSYFYSFGAGGIDLPLNEQAVGLDNNPNQNVTLHALLCMLDLDRDADPIVQGCTTDPSLQDNRYFMVTLMARGQADCDGNGANCTAEALITEKIGSFGPGGGEGGPDVPLTARTSVPLSGTVEIVPNPNGGGVGVPISTWANANQSCPDGVPVSPDSGSYATCERHEWYGVDIMPEDYTCPTNNCACSNGERLLSYARGNNRVLGVDIVIDENFPCDLWAYMFGIPKVDWEKVKAMVPPANRLTSCASLDENSFGFYWISGNECRLQTRIGSVNAPVFLISAAGDTRANAQAEIFGVLMTTDVENAGATFTGNGTATIYGAAVMDTEMKNFNGTFQIVYLDNVINQVTETGAFGAVQGGWSDFHAAWQ